MDLLLLGSVFFVSRMISVIHGKKSNQAPDLKERTNLGHPKQIISTSAFTFGKYVDLSWCGSPCLSQVEITEDRPLPQESTIKQISLKKNPIGRWYITCTIEADKSVFTRDFGPPLQKKL